MIVEDEMKRIRLLNPIRSKARDGDLKRQLMVKWKMRDKW